jgi:peptide/nickel transport system substrate-binding protein
MIGYSWRRALAAGLAIGALLAPVDAGGSQAGPRVAVSSTLVIGYDSFPTDLNPFTEPDEASWQVLEMTAGFLVDISPTTLQPVPAVAKSWTITSSGKVYTFHIRPGVRFSDGNALTAADVAWTMTNYANPKISPVVASFYNQMVSATALDPLTLRVTLKQPSAPFLANAAQMFILEKKVFEHLKINKANWGTNYTQWPIGPGPWMIKEVVPNDHITLAPNPYYWGGKAKIQTLIWKTVPDDNTLFAQLQTGEVQATPLLSRFARVLDKSRFTAYSSSSLQWYSVWLNFHRPFFADRQVRQAMMYAIDRAGMVKAVYTGGADIMNAEIPPAVGALYNANVPNKYPYDPAKAKSLLTAAGWKPGSGGTLAKGGVKFSFNLLFVRGDSQGEQMATIIQQNLASVGISVQLQGLDYSVLNNSRLNTGNFDAVVNSYYNYAFPDNVFQFGCKETPADSGTNYGSYCNATVDKLLQQADATTDPAAQKRVFATLQNTLNQDLPYLWLLSPRSSWAMAKAVTGYVANPVDSDIWQAWQWSSRASAGY